MKNLFYFMSRDYPADIILVKVGKGNVDLDTGARSQTEDRRLSMTAVVPPTRTINTFLSKLAGRIIVNNTAFLIETVPGLVLVPETDYVVYQGREYRNLVIYDVLGYTIIEGAASV